MITSHWKRNPFAMAAAPITVSSFNMISSFLEQFAPGKTGDLQTLLFETGSIAAGLPLNRFLYHCIGQKSDCEAIDGDLFVFVHKSFTKLKQFFEETVRDK